MMKFDTTDCVALIVARILQIAKVWCIYHTIVLYARYIKIKSGKFSLKTYRITAETILHLSHIKLHCAKHTLTFIFTEIM